MSFPIDILKRCWFLAGPTAVGKSATALALAGTLDAEIVSMDSMAVYRGMDIGTAKPSAAEQLCVPHHLINVADPSEDFSVAQYLQYAQRAAEEILERNRIPLFVGGTGLYLRSILRGVFEGPEADWPLRRRLQEQAESSGHEWLHGTLQKVDPVTANRLHSNDVRRIIRALEVFEITGRPLSDQHQQCPLPADQRPVAVFWIDPPRNWLHDRINLRVDRMMDNGLLLETRQLLQHQPPPGRTACQALGYRELIGHIRANCSTLWPRRSRFVSRGSGSRGPDAAHCSETRSNGKYSLDAAIEQIKTATRQFAKRQHTWFRNLEECRSVPISGDETAEELADRLLLLAESR